MVEPTFLVGLAAVFLFILVFILRSNTSDPSKEQLKRDKKQKPIKERKPKGPKKNALKKEKRPNEVREWSGVDTAAKDAQEMLEFLKGKDPAELAKQQKSQEKQQINNRKKQPKKAKTEEVAAQSSEDSSNETALTEEGFSVISKKVNDKKKQKEVDPGKKNAQTKRPKLFFKPAPGEEGEQKNEKKPRKERQDRKPQSSEENVEGGENKKKGEGEQENRERRPRRERPEGEEGGEDKPRRERQERPVRKPLPTVAPIVKYEQADLNDILNSITQDYKPKPKAHRISTVFSKIPRNIVITILSKLEARDLVALSEVNHYFSSVARKDSLWKELLFRDFGVRDFGKYRNFRAAYRGENKKRQAAKKKVQEAKEIVPQDESKDSKAKKDIKKTEAPKEVEQATHEERTTEEQ